MAPPTDTSWERWLKRLTDGVAYATLVASTALAVLAGQESGGELLVTLLIAALAALWVYVLYGRAPEPRPAQRLRMAVFFVGVMVFASVLMVRDPRFFIFMISGFFYASALRPLPLAILGVFVTSFLINTLLGGIPSTPDGWTFYLSIIVIQTIVIGVRLGDRREDHRAEPGAEGRAGSPRGGARGERRAASPARRAGARGGRPRRARADGPRDPRHDRPRAHRRRDPARGGARPPPTGRSSSAVTSRTPPVSHARAWSRRGARSTPPGRRRSSRRACPTRSRRWRAAGRRSTRSPSR